MSRCAGERDWVCEGRFVRSDRRGRDLGRGVCEAEGRAVYLEEVRGGSVCGVLRLSVS